MKAQLDVHTHSIASGHAYGTVTEMAKAASEMEFAAGKFDYVLVNDDLQTAFAEAEEIISEFLKK